MQSSADQETLVTLIIKLYGNLQIIICLCWGQKWSNSRDTETLPA